MAQADQAADQRLLDAVQALVADHPEPALAGFRANLANWGSVWRGLPPRDLPCTARLDACVEGTVSTTRALTEQLLAERATRHWEQSYSRADGVVGEDMLAGYGFTELVGKNGPFVSERIRVGLNIWAPDIVYPRHRHRPEEIYLLLAGEASFRLGDAPPVPCRAGEVVHVPSGLVHGFTVGASGMLLLYLWQGGDLREISSFV